jgi:phage terminase large subunit
MLQAATLQAEKAAAALADESSRDNEDELNEPPTPREVPSVVLDRSHPISDFYYKKCRWKIAKGGRGSVKSWGTAEALIRLASVMPLRVLCCREYQNSIADSSHKLLKNTIYRLGLEGWFEVTEKTIKCPRIGSEFIFKGLHNNEQGIRSTEDVDICLIEEAQSVSMASLEALEPTIRKPGSEIWAIYNVIEESDPIHQLALSLIANGDVARGEAFVHEVNYDQNPWFDHTPLRAQMERMKRTNYDLYEHIWEGKPRKRSNAIILRDKYVVEEFPDDLYKKAERLLFGADFGFADDPSTLIRFFRLPVDKYADGQILYDLYIEYEAYGHHVEVTDMERFYEGGESHHTPNLEFEGVPGARSWPIKADSARPETISHVRGQGFSISAAEKWQGSVEDGIAHLRGYRKIIIHPRCKKTAEEAYMWRYKVDKNQRDAEGQPLVLPVVVDANNHCWDAIRYGLDGYITRGGAIGAWARIARADAKAMEAAKAATWAALARAVPTSPRRMT